MHATRPTTGPPRSRQHAGGHHNVSKPRGASEIDQEARAIAEIMRSDLKAQPPWSRDIEQQRQRARNLYQTILFSHPLSTHAQSLDPLWHNTTYTLITAYRTSISRIETSLPSPQPHPRKPQHQPQNHPSLMEYKKVLTRFRQLLISEETFYRNLTTRLVRFHSLQTTTQAHLEEVGLGLAEGVGAGEKGLAPDGLGDGKETVGLVYKALVCLGDLERYRVQYDEKVKKDLREGKVGGLRGKEMFAKAWRYYEAARGLNPDDGSAFNQMAVIATYQMDDFLTLYNYIRAMAIKNAFRNINDILDKFLRRNREKSVEVDLIGGMSWEYDESEAEEVTEEMKRSLVGIIGGIYRRSSMGKAKGEIPLFQHYLGELLRNRSLPSETIVKFTVIIIGTHWYARQSSSIAAPGTTDDAPMRREAEDLAVDLLLETFGNIFDVAAAEVGQGLRTKSSGTAIEEDDEEVELHQYITAVLRRLLPTLRIISKWIKLHVVYLSRFPQSVTRDFWDKYENLLEGLADLFPMELLPGCHEVLEEDLDMRGFVPLMRGLSGIGGEDRLGGKRGDGQAHPNEEQLMRIADLQVDARLLIQPQNDFPVSEASVGDGIPDIASVSTETEDDPVNLAMRATLGSSSTEDEDEEREEEEEEEVILWGNRSGGLTSGHAGSPAQRAPKPQTTAFDLLQNLMLDVPRSVAQAQTPPTPQAHVVPRRPSAPQTALPLAPGQSSPGLLFGGDGTGSSIWSMTREESDRGVKRSAVPALGAKDVASIWADAAPSPQTAPPLQGISQQRPSVPTSPWSGIPTPHTSAIGGYAQQQYSAPAKSPWGTDGMFGAARPGMGVRYPSNGDIKWQGHYPG